MDLFRVRLDCIDHYQATPSCYDPPLRNDLPSLQPAKRPKVPIVRVFGSTETGQKVCAHIHGAFPYLYIEYDGSLEAREVGLYIYRLHLSVDHALALSYRRDQAGADAAFVARITLVKGVPFYGFHVGYRFFLKIYLFNPVFMTRLAELLQQGVIMQRNFQPYEAHLQYLLQFMIDYNLYGCGYLDASSAVFRAPIPSYDAALGSSHLWHDRSIPRDRVTDDGGSLFRCSHSSLEVDIFVHDILNRARVKERLLHHDLSQPNHPPSPNLKLVPSMAELWSHEARRRNVDEDTIQMPREALLPTSTLPRDVQASGFIHGADYRAQVRDHFVGQRGSQNLKDMNSQCSGEPDPLESTVRTAFQSVDDLHSSNLLTTLGIGAQLLQHNLDPASSIDVDEARTKELTGEAADPLFGIPNNDPLSDVSDEEDDDAARSYPKPLDGDKAWTEKAEPNRISTGPDPTQPFKVPYPRIEGVFFSSATTKRKFAFPVYSELMVAAKEEGLLSIDPNAQQLQLEDSVHRVEGVYLSSVTTRQKLSFPISQEFMVAAKEERLLSINPQAQQRIPEDAAQHAHKRLRSSPELQAPRKKRLMGSSPMHSSPVKQQVGPGVGPRDSLAIVPTISSPIHCFDPGTRKSIHNQSQGLCINQNLDDPGPFLLPSGKSRGINLEHGELPSAGPAALLSVTTSPSGIQIDDILPSTPGWSNHDDSTPVPPLTPAQMATESIPDPRGRPNIKCLSMAPPSVEDVCSTFRQWGIPEVVHRDAYYSNEADVPARPREYAGKVFCLQGDTLPYLSDIDLHFCPSLPKRKRDQESSGHKMGIFDDHVRQKACTFRSWEVADPPPGYSEVKSWWEERCAAKKAPSALQQSPHTDSVRGMLSQIEGPTPSSKHVFKYSQRRKARTAQLGRQYMTTMSLEIHVNTRGRLVPDPEKDEVQCIFWAIDVDDETLDEEGEVSGRQTLISGIVSLEHQVLPSQQWLYAAGEVATEAMELDLLVRLISIVRMHDPDILTGYDVHSGSWGYLIERARLKFELDLCQEFSRLKCESHAGLGKNGNRWDSRTTSTVRITGRHVINVWRAMRSELNLLQYTLENVAWHILHVRVPHYSWQTLTSWYTSGKPNELFKLVRYYTRRTRLNLRILDANDVIARTSEQARLLGVDFFSVFSRGSQYKVESIMFRIAKPENFMLVSPSRKQVAGQNALECLPLVMEPQSGFYSSPVVVLDFQSLYPSLIIAYNYCYSTFLGRADGGWRGKQKMGFTEHRISRRLVERLHSEEQVRFAPNGMMYAKTGVRTSLLGRMLKEILETRVLVKSALKRDHDDKSLQRLLNNRQLALKMLANVTYGYASASFSGRMPCSEIADSIVQTGRETLESAMAYIHSVERWGAEVVYGDTDSLFISLPGRTRAEAFTIGEEMTTALTRMNPRPVKLKFEKVYHPCVLLAKKRYVGYKFETPEQVRPKFEAKGIETVRRDGTPAEQKMEERALRILFETADLSQVKRYFQDQCDKIMCGAVSVQDFCYAREVKLGTYSNHRPGPAGALVSARRMLEDARAEPQFGERVPYVVITGPPRSRLIDRCVAPEELLANPQCRLDAEYYITKNLIPPLERIFNLVGANVRSWYDEMPKIQRSRRGAAPMAPPPAGAGGAAGPSVAATRTLDGFFRLDSCYVCRRRIMAPGPQAVVVSSTTLCARCAGDAGGTVLRLRARLAREQRVSADVLQACRSCAGLGPLDEVRCDNGDCPVYYTRRKQDGVLQGEQAAIEPVLQRLAAQSDARAW